MILPYYYRTSHADVIAGKTKDFEESRALELKAQAFTSRFGGIPLFSQGLVPHFVGMGFKGTKPAEPRLWSAPKANDIRVAPKLHNVPPKLRAQAQHLGREWDDNYPHDLTKKRTSYLLAGMGLREEDLDGTAMSLFMHNGVAWVAFTKSLPDERYEEVKRSELERAQAELMLEQQQLEENARKAFEQGMMPVAAVPANDEEVKES